MSDATPDTHEGKRWGVIDELRFSVMPWCILEEAAWTALELNRLLNCPVTFEHNEKTYQASVQIREMIREPEPTDWSKTPPIMGRAK